MAQLQLIKQSSGILIPATPETSDLLQSKIKLGAVLVADFKQVRKLNREERRQLMDRAIVLTVIEVARRGLVVPA